MRNTVAWYQNQCSTAMTLRMKGLQFLEEVSLPVDVSNISLNPGLDGVLECLHMEQKCSSIEELLNCAMCPNRFRIRARIVEYYPRYIGDFVKVECNACGKMYVTKYICVCVYVVSLIDAIQPGCWLPSLSRLRRTK